MPVIKYHSVNGQIMGASTGATFTPYLTDALGSVTATVSGGGIQNTYRYKPYGERPAKSGAGADPAYQWTGNTGSRVTNRTHSEQYNQHRHYGVTQGHWTSPDADWPRQMAYVYVRCSPTGLTDPTGQAPTNSSCGANCCAHADDWFAQRSSHCGDGWVAYPDLQAVKSACKDLPDSDRDKLRDAILWVAGKCNSMCGQRGGGGYAPEDPWDAAAFCCIDPDGRSRGCEVRCCRSMAEEWKRGPLAACLTKCLLVHERNHLIECNKFLPYPGIPPSLPYSECCAYWSQMQCLLDTYKQLCPSRYFKDINGAIAECESRAKGANCSTRYL